MGYTWSTKKCDPELWKKVPITAQELCMAMQGSDIHEILRENMDEVVKFIHKSRLLTDLKTNEPMPIGDIRVMVFCAVGFRRQWN